MLPRQREGMLDFQWTAAASERTNPRLGLDKEADRWTSKKYTTQRAKVHRVTDRPTELRCCEVCNSRNALRLLSARRVIGIFPGRRGGQKSCHGAQTRPRYIRQGCENGNVSNVSVCVSRRVNKSVIYFSCIESCS